MTVSTARGQRSPLMFGCEVIPLHHCHAASIVHRLLRRLLIRVICVKLGHDGAMLRGHSAPRPVIGDPGVRQALPHDRAMTYTHTHTHQKDSYRSVNISSKDVVQFFANPAPLVPLLCTFQCFIPTLTPN